MKHKVKKTMILSLALGTLVNSSSVVLASEGYIVAEKDVIPYTSEYIDIDAMLVNGMMGTVIVNNAAFSSTPNGAVLGTLRINDNVIHAGQHRTVNGVLWENVRVSGVGGTVWMRSSNLRWIRSM